VRIQWLAEAFPSLRVYRRPFDVVEEVERRLAPTAQNAFLCR
jgi:hypothetical protein